MLSLLLGVIYLAFISLGLPDSLPAPRSGCCLYIFWRCLS